jgi:hypothetical protein
MKLLTKTALAVAVAITAASAANATVCTNPALSTLSSLTGTSAPTLACVNEGVDIVSPVTGSYNTKTNVATPVVNSKTNQAISDDQSGKTVGYQSGPTAAQGGISLGNVGAGQTGSLGGGYFSPVKTGALSQSNSAQIFGANINSPISQTNNGSTGTGNAVSGTLAGINGNVGNQQTQLTGPQTQALVTSQIKNSTNQAVSKTGVTTIQH